MTIAKKIRHSCKCVNAIKVAKAKQEPICYYCGCLLNEYNVTVDHLTPLSRGGTNSQSNLRVCCINCNNEKGDMTEMEYMDYKASLKAVKSKSAVELNKSDYVVQENINSIQVPWLFRQHPVQDKKIRKVELYYKIYHQLDKPITLNSRHRKELIDGYARYVFAISHQLETVPVVYKY